MTELTREKKLALIYRHTHRDFKGKLNGEKSILVFRTGEGTCLVTLNALTDAEIADKLPSALRREEARKLGDKAVREGNA